MVAKKNVKFCNMEKILTKLTQKVFGKTSRFITLPISFNEEQEWSYILNGGGSYAPKNIHSEVHGMTFVEVCCSPKIYPVATRNNRNCAMNTYSQNCHRLINYPTLQWHFLELNHACKISQFYSTFYNLVIVTYVGRLIEWFFSPL